MRNESQHISLICMDTNRYIRATKPGISCQFRVTRATKAGSAVIHAAETSLSKKRKTLSTSLNGNKPSKLAMIPFQEDEKASPSINEDINLSAQLRSWHETSLTDSQEERALHELNS